jgi:hypothetical protein
MAGGEKLEEVRQEQDRFYYFEDLVCFESNVGAMFAKGSSSKGKKPTIRWGWTRE